MLSGTARNIGNCIKLLDTQHAAVCNCSSSTDRLLPWRLCAMRESRIRKQNSPNQMSTNWDNSSLLEASRGTLGFAPTRRLRLCNPENLVVFGAVGLDMS